MHERAAQSKLRGAFVMRRARFMIYFTAAVRARCASRNERKEVL